MRLLCRRVFSSIVLIHVTYFTSFYVFFIPPVNMLAMKVATFLALLLPFGNMFPPKHFLIELEDSDEELAESRIKTRMDTQNKAALWNNAPMETKLFNWAFERRPWRG